MTNVDELTPFPDSEEVVRYRPIEGDKELALIKALPPHSFGDGHEIYNSRVEVIAMCGMAEYASLICRTLNESYAAWLSS